LITNGIGSAWIRPQSYENASNMSVILVFKQGFKQISCTLSELGSAADAIYIQFLVCFTPKVGCLNWMSKKK
jgi:hypothetical protein